MNPLPARRYARARPRLRLSGALAFGRYALAFRVHRGAPAATIGPPRLQRRPRTLAAFTRRALELRAPAHRAAPQAQL
ncbi:hypothetical protein [Xanthomonas vesicatoria]|uniref:Uncharacterized protein n=1 Tax=Xanthomonas vesicatoria TaxID=56460 RepID=A0AAJ0N2K4_9XANT|nr:hypothetical protein [Xanthomonas vesicatoria]APO96987.1 hypothetical protein BI313_22515 [Xanthomonas vesicatoria]KHM91309.1 hypothetical protein OR61_19440 [Xanthomonas vesicatoria]KHM92292.1 hypothetical protein OR60_17090 [Xanthomonas vesicatoria]MCC8623846.1 hypothetical protein [Xanthomonas vesicatoria]MCC8695547.1 hypothetical protein [Xanthomonas vesicatoria]